MSITLIITVYKDYQALQSVLYSVVRQTLIPSQIIIAHDTIDDSIQSILNDFHSTLNIDYINQVDTGFNKNRILNKAILRSNFDKLVFIDGDCLLHFRAIENYNNIIKKGIFAAGRRLDLDKKSSTQIRNKKGRIPTLFTLLKNTTKRIEEGFYLPFVPHKCLSKPKLLGCNMGWNKDDLISLNGFDMDYQLPGFGEDTDIEWRAKLKGLNPINMRWKVIQYHLFHERPDREIDIGNSKNLFYKKQEKGYFYCENGLAQVEDDFNY